MAWCVIYLNHMARQKSPIDRNVHQKMENLHGCSLVWASFMDAPVHSIQIMCVEDFKSNKHLQQHWLVQ